MLNEGKVLQGTELAGADDIVTTPGELLPLIIILQQCP
jgi:hypothetical protein